MRNFFVLGACFFFSQKLFASDFKFGIAEESISPLNMDTYGDLNRNLKWDSEEPWKDNNGNGQFDPTFIAGYSQNRMATKVHDDIKSIAVTFVQGEKRVAIVALDTIGWFRSDIPEIQKEISKKYKIDSLLVHATHNHEAPDTIGLWGPSFFKTGADAAYVNYIKTKVTKALEKAILAERAAEMTHGELPEVPVEVGQVDTRPYPNVLDKRLNVAQFKDYYDGKILGTIVNFGNHVETLWGNNLEITADYPGFLRDALQKGVKKNNSSQVTIVEATRAPVLFWLVTLEDWPRPRMKRQL